MVTSQPSIPREKHANCGLCTPFRQDALLVRRFSGARPSPAASGAGGRRTPLAGEIVHKLDSGRLMCELCFAALPADRRLAVSSERVPAGERRLSVVPKAA